MLIEMMQENNTIETWVRWTKGGNRVICIDYGDGKIVERVVGKVKLRRVRRGKV